MLRPKASAATANPADAGSVQLREDDLAGFAQTTAAQHLARLEGDKELVLQLMLHGYTGETWRTFSCALVEYGLQVMRAWIGTGRIFEQCKRKGRGVLPTTNGPRGEDEVMELAGMVVTVALNAFRDKVLVPGKWDPSRGASLKTFFIGQCVLRFPNEYRGWKSATEAMGLDVFAEHIVQARASSATMAELREAWSATPPDDVGKMRAMIEMGYSQEEVAELVGVTKRSVDSKLYRDSQGQRSAR